MNEAENQNRPPLTTSAFIAGTALFLLLGLELILNELPREWALPSWVEQLRFVVFLLGVIAPSVGFATGWMKSFPRWAYPYMGLMIFMGLYMQRVATPGWTIAGHDVFGRELWSWRAWVLPTVAGLVGLIGTRSFHPLLKLVQGAWEDWTKATYALFGGMPLFIAAMFDEMDRLYSLPFMVILTLFMMTTSLLYLRSTSSRERVLYLLLGNAAIMILGFVAVEVFWAPNYGANPLRMMLLLGLFLSLLFTPALVGVIRRSILTSTT